MKKKYISIILASIMAVTPLQAAASSDFSEDRDSEAFQEGTGRADDAIEQSALFEQAGSAAQPEEYASSQDSFDPDSLDMDSCGSDYYGSDGDDGLAGTEVQFGDDAVWNAAELTENVWQAEESGSQSGISGSDRAAGTGESSSGESTSGDSSSGESTSGDSLAGLSSSGLGADGESESGTSSSDESETGGSAVVVNADGKNADSNAPDELLTDEKKGSPEAVDGESVQTTGTSVLTDGLTPSAKENEEQAEDSFPQSGVYESFTWKVEEISPEDDLEAGPENGSEGGSENGSEGNADNGSDGSSESSGDKPSGSTDGSTGDGSEIPLKLTIEGSGALSVPVISSESSENSPVAFPESDGPLPVTFPESDGPSPVTFPETAGNSPVTFPETAGPSPEGNESVIPATETGIETGSETETEKETDSGTGKGTGTESGTENETGSEDKIDEATGFPWDSWKERITQISLGEGVTGIGDGVFSGYTELESIRIPKSVEGVTSIATDAFDGSAAGFTIYGAFDSFAETYARKYGHPFIGIINGKLGEDLEWELAGERNRLTLTISGSGSMAGFSSWPWENYRDSIIAVKIGDSVNDIGERTFEKCIQLAEVELGASIQEIGRHAFMDCSQLKRVEFPELLLRIGAGAFSGCVSLEELDFPEKMNLLSIESSAFSDCISLGSVVIPKTVRTLGSYAFYRCSGLKNIILPDGISVIEKKTFSGCTQLGEVTLPFYAETIEEEAFSGCTGLINVSAENSWLQKIRTGAFMGCSQLESISVPGCLLEIGKSAFELCSSLKMISLPDGIRKVESRVFYNCRKLASVGLPESITSVGDWAFYNCSSLSELNLPKQLKSIGRWSFAGCWGIRELNLPDSVEQLGSYAFLDCRDLRVIETTRNLKTIGTLAFSGCDDRCVMYGVRGSTAQQYAADNDITFIDRRYDLSNAVVSGIETKVWKEGGVSQDPKVVLNGKVLKKGTDYTLSYRNNRDVGRAEVRINSAGNYDGFCIRNFRINPKQVTGLRLTAGSREFKATWKEEEGETLSGYELQYSTSASFKNAVTLTIGKSSTPWKRVTKLKAGTTYYVRVRAFRKKGTNVYSSKWSTTQKVKTLK